MNWTKKIIIIVMLACGLTACKTTATPTGNGNAVPGEVLIDFEVDFQSEKIEQRFAEYELKRKKTVSPSLNIVLFTYNPEKVEIHQLIEELKKEQGVEEAQSNKRITKRS